MIGWLAASIDGNEERGKMISDLQKAASHGQLGLVGISWRVWLCSVGIGYAQLGSFRYSGPDLSWILIPPPSFPPGFFVNLDAVMLRLCGPFLDPSNANFWKR